MINLIICSLSSLFTVVSFWSISILYSQKYKWLILKQYGRLAIKNSFCLICSNDSKGTEIIALVSLLVEFLTSCFLDFSFFFFSND